MSIKRSIVLRVRIAYLVILLIAVALVYQIFNIQVNEGEEWKERGKRFMFSFREVKSTRGNIYSDNGSLLATSLPFYRVAIDPTVAEDEVFGRLEEGFLPVVFPVLVFFRNWIEAKVHRTHVQGGHFRFGAERGGEALLQ